MSREIAAGATIEQIMRETERSRGLARKILRGQRSDIIRTRESSLEPHLACLDEQWIAGCRNGDELWRRLRVSGLRGSLRVVSGWASRRRRAEKMDAAGLRRTPSARTIARLTRIGRDTLSKAETPTIVAIENNVPALVDSRAAVEEFQTTIRKKAGDALDGWIDRAKAGLLASFANRVVRDRAAVAAAITNRWPNGQTEGQIARLKLIKRQMCGRAKRDLLEERLIGADPTTRSTTPGDTIQSPASPFGSSAGSVHPLFYAADPTHSYAKMPVLRAIGSVAHDQTPFFRRGEYGHRVEIFA